jgi:hypothetical protein
MPYIKLADRAKFKNHITEIVNLMIDGNANEYNRGEQFGYYVNRLVRRFLGDPDYTKHSFNSMFFGEPIRKTIDHNADSIAANLQRSTPIESAGDLNYCISAVYWGVLGQTKNANPARYGVHAYYAGMLEKIRSTVDTVNVGNQADMTVAFRRHIVIRGVLTHVIEETYRRSLSPYEEQKIAENGDVWKGGELVQEGE